MIGMCFCLSVRRIISTHVFFVYQTLLLSFFFLVISGLCVRFIIFDLSLSFFYVSQCFSAIASIFFLLIILLILLSFLEKHTFINKTIDIIIMVFFFFFFPLCLRSALKLSLFFNLMLRNLTKISKTFIRAFFV
jgi:hypothetical protein